MERHRSTLAACLLLAFALVLAGCGGGDDPEPDGILDRALTRQNLSGLTTAPGGGVVAVQALGFEDQVLQSKSVKAPPSVMTSIGESLGSSGSGLRDLVDDLEYVGVDQLDGVVVDHVSGGLEEEGLATALEDAGGEEVTGLAGLDPSESLAGSLAEAEFDMYVGRDDGVIRRLDLVLALDDPDNALPPTRIRFSLTSARPSPVPQ